MTLCPLTKYGGTLLNFSISLHAANVCFVHQGSVQSLLDRKDDGKSQLAVCEKLGKLHRLSLS